MNVNLDSANKIPGYFDSPWPSECGGPRRQKIPRSKGLNVQNTKSDSEHDDSNEIESSNEDIIIETP